MSEILDASKLEELDSFHQSLADKLGMNHPIKVAIEKPEHRIRDMEDCLPFLPNVREQTKSQQAAFWRELREATEMIDKARAKIDIGKL